VSAPRPAPVRILFVPLLCLSLVGCGGEEGGTELWIYTSIYPHVIEDLRPHLEAAFPEVRFRWYQKGSEQVAARLNAEIEAGSTDCDLLLTSDPFYFVELAERGLLLRRESGATAGVPAALKDPGGAFATVRIPVMVIGVNRDRLSPEARPRAFRDLVRPELRRRVALGDPLKSGTAFTTVASWVRQHGWEFVEALRANEVVSAGGSTTVRNALETGERLAGVVLLEDLLHRLRAAPDAPLAVVYPEDGAVPVPSPAAILASTDHPELAGRVFDFFFGRVAQDALVRGAMYSPFPDHAPPEGAPVWNDLPRAPWDCDALEWVSGRRSEIKERFREIMAR
jgi:iron(III) transport system substrate-binding protein